MTVGKFGHHPDPPTDAEAEVERLTGLLCEAHAGLLRVLSYPLTMMELQAVKADVRDALRRSGYTGNLGTRSVF